NLESDLGIAAFTDSKACQNGGACTGSNNKRCRGEVNFGFARIVRLHESLLSDGWALREFGGEHLNIVGVRCWPFSEELGSDDHVRSLGFGGRAQSLFPRQVVIRSEPRHPSS